MPKQPPPTATEKELDDWLKERGYDTGNIQAGTPGKVPEAPSGVEAKVNQFIEDYPAVAGVGQGLAGYAEAPAYYAERGIREFNPEFRMPGHERAADIRNRVESTAPGRWGEVAGIMAPAFLPSGPVGRMMSEARMPELLRLAKTWEDMGPGLRGMTQGAVTGVMANPARTPQEAWDQLTMGGLFGGLGGSAAGRLGQKAAAAEAERAAAESARASKAGKEAMKGWADTEELAAAEERENVAKAGMRYTGRPEQFGARRDFSNIERFAPEKMTAEGKTPRDILRERTRRERAERAEEKAAEKKKAAAEKEAAKPEPETYNQKLARNLAKGAGFTLGHLTIPHPLQRVMGHVFAANFDDALRRMNRGEAEGLRDYIDTFLAGQGRRKTLLPRAGPTAGAFGTATRENDPTQWLINPIEPLPGTPGAR